MLAPSIPAVSRLRPEEGWARMIDVHQTGVFNDMKAAAPELLKGVSLSGTGPAVWKGRVFVNSGYGIYSHIAGNVLLVYGPKIQARH